METETEQGPQATPLGQYAGFFTRLLAFVIDLLIITLVVTATVTVGRFILQSFGVPEFTEWVATWCIVAFDFLFSVAYFLGYWLLAGQTPGKRVMGLRLVRTDGRRLKFGNALRRLVGYWLFAALLFLGYLWVLVDNRRQAWHDKLAGTLVVYSWPEVTPLTLIRDQARQLEERSGE